MGREAGVKELAHRDIVLKRKSAAAAAAAAKARERGKNPPDGSKVGVNGLGNSGRELMLQGLGPVQAVANSKTEGKEFLGGDSFPLSAEKFPFSATRSKSYHAAAAFEIIQQSGNATSGGNGSTAVVSGATVTAIDETRQLHQEKKMQELDNVRKIINSTQQQHRQHQHANGNIWGETKTNNKRSNVTMGREL